MCRLVPAPGPMRICGREPSGRSGWFTCCELQRAAANLKKALPGIEVLAYFVDFEGIWEVELDSGASSRLNTVPLQL